MIVAVLCLAVALVAASTAAVTARFRSQRLVAEIEDRDARLAAMAVRLEQNNQLESQLSRALDAMDMGVVLARRDGVVVFRNHAAETFVAARHGKALVEAAVQDLLARSLAGEADEHEVEFHGPPLQAFQVRSFPLSTSDAATPVGALVLVEESTERRRVDQVRRDFVANISHELKTPIGALGLLAETIVDEPDPVTVRRLTLRMTDEAERVARTIDDLLELSRIEFGDETKIDFVALDAVVNEAISRIRSAAEQNGITIEVIALPDVVVQGDRRQLTSALYNLLDNAVKYSPAGSTVTVSGTTSASASGSVVRLAVTDEGVGIPSRDLDRVFERFYRVDRARSRETGGTGLGLAIVRHVVANHGGEITVRSREGEGSTFTLELPVTGVPAAPRTPQVVPEADTTKATP